MCLGIAEVDEDGAVLAGLIHAAVSDKSREGSRNDAEDQQKQRGNDNCFLRQKQLLALAASIGKFFSVMVMVVLTIARHFDSPFSLIFDKILYHIFDRMTISILSSIILGESFAFCGFARALLCLYIKARTGERHGAANHRGRVIGHFITGFGDDAVHSV